MVTRGWVGPAIGLVVCLVLLFLLVPLFTGIVHTLLQIFLVLGVVVCIVWLVASFVRT